MHCGAACTLRVWASSRCVVCGVHAPRVPPAQGRCACAAHPHPSPLRRRWARPSTIPASQGAHTLLLPTPTQALRASKHQPSKPGPRVVRVLGDGIVALDESAVTYDVVVAGGTLGLMLAATLQRRGYRVRVV